MEFFSILFTLAVLPAQGFQESSLISFPLRDSLRSSLCEFPWSQESCALLDHEFLTVSQVRSMQSSQSRTRKSKEESASDGGETLSRAKILFEEKAFEEKKRLVKTSIILENSKREIDSVDRKSRKLYECISEEVQVNTQTANPQKCPFVLTLTDEKVVILWVDYDDYSVRGQVLDTNLTPDESEFAISSDSYEFKSRYFGAVLLSTGYYAVLWKSESEQIVFKIMDDASEITSETVVNTLVSIDDGEADNFQTICPSQSGGFLAIWVRVDSSRQQTIKGRIYDSSGNPTTDEFDVHSTNMIITYSRCTGLLDGNFIVVWGQLGGDDDRYGIQFQMIDAAGSSVGDLTQANTYETSDQFSPSIATLIGGEFVIAWQSFGQDFEETYGVYAQLYSSSAEPIGDETLVNTYVEGDQGYPEIAAMYDGGFLVIWQSYDQNGYASGVYGQRFDNSGTQIDGEIIIALEADSSQACVSASTIANGFIAAWESGEEDDDQNEILSKGFYDTNSIANPTSCNLCSADQYLDLDSETCQDCREECSTCDDGINCTACNDSAAGLPSCCLDSALLDGNPLSVVSAAQYFSGTECVDCEENCGTCDSEGCLTCIITGISCCTLPRVLQPDGISCDCSPECLTCDSVGCLSCSSSEDCCPSSRYFDSTSNSCEECETNDDIGCLTCPSEVSTCCPNGRFFDSSSETCEDCLIGCETCEDLTECTSCDGSVCCGEGRYADINGICQDCPTDCVTCSDGSSCDICRDPNYTIPECCPDGTEDDLNADGFCECLDGTTPISGCQCQSNEAWYFDGSVFVCQGPFILNPLTIEGISEIGSSCSEILELRILDYESLPDTEVTPKDYRWFSDSSSLAAYLRGQVSNPLSVANADLPVGTTTFTAYMSLYGAIFTGTHSVTKSDSLPLTVTLSQESVITLTSEDTLELVATVSSQPCPSITYSWTPTTSSASLPVSSTDTLLISPGDLPVDTYTFYTFSVSSGSATETQTVIFFVTDPVITAVIEPVGPSVSSNEDLVLDASNSSDSSNDTQPLSYNWICIQTGLISCPSFTDSTSSQITILASELTSGMSFTMFVIVYKDTRSDSASVSLTVED